MSVSGIPSAPAGFDVLFPSGTPGSANNGTASSGTSSSGTSSSIPSNTPGADALNAPLDTPTVPGFDVLQPASYFPGANATTSSTSSTGSGSGANSSSSGSGSSTTVNPYQQAYDNIETWSNSYLMSSVENGAPSTLPDYSGGESAGSFASLNTLLAQLKPLVALNAQAANGTSASATTSSGASGGSTGSTIDTLA